MLLGVSLGSGGGLTLTTGRADFEGSWDAGHPLIALGIVHVD